MLSMNRAAKFCASRDGRFGARRMGHASRDLPVAGCLRRMIFFGEASLRRAVSEFVVHYHEERAHQGIENERIDRRGVVGDGK